MYFKNIRNSNGSKLLTCTVHINQTLSKVISYLFEGVIVIIILMF